ncbi:MAG: serine hydrolase [Psychroserpens sp.]|nr:serine hydrolase [Psychroserpens sp.]MBO6606897.1 serine hydrolase [Psychroserpens sp.]MBO6631879.1 serine hydrolase [Psychroserpens sp.]MBO6654043.1 serine hydrolase [Psychroserpens sp.]MBO6682671.1 serine hydrolase [Psychroserpens sp.]MBO6750669.1 serine hydrolase [Psychroserpens sp.]
MNVKYLIILFALILFNCSTDDDNTDQEIIISTEPSSIYFPPLTNNAEWETKSIDELSWNAAALQPLIDFLDEKNTKGFIILHEGKIVVESYLNGHTESSPWYWASAGKTLTTTVTGIAQDNGLLDIDDKVSDYIGTGWTSAAPEREDLITCKNLLSMNSGLDDSLGDSVAPENLQYIADAGTRWAYHNVYVKLQDVVSSASNQSWSNYFDQVLKSKIGMTGTWIQNGDFSTFWSRTRSMARYGLMIYAEGRWENEQIISQAFLNEAINTSQDLNQAYGYMWWLNGKSTYRLPQLQLEFPGEIIPNAPETMFCALGRDDQKIYIVPDQNLVVVRMGESADDLNFALSNFDDELWAKINALINN